jgi:hypothetical protein
MAMRLFEVVVGRIMVLRIGKFSSLLVDAESEQDAKKKAESFVEEERRKILLWAAHPHPLGQDFGEIKVLDVQEVDAGSEELKTLREEVSESLKEFSCENLAAAYAELRKEDRKHGKS